MDNVHEVYQVYIKSSLYHVFYFFYFNCGFGLSMTFPPIITPDNRELPVAVYDIDKSRFIRIDPSFRLHHTKLHSEGYLILILTVNLLEDLLNANKDEMR
jgi:hypothetical protein